MDLAHRWAAEYVCLCGGRNVHITVDGASDSQFYGQLAGCEWEGVHPLLLVNLYLHQHGHYLLHL